MMAIEALETQKLDHGLKDDRVVERHDQFDVTKMSRTLGLRETTGRATGRKSVH